MTDDRLTVAEAAEITGKSRRTIGRLLNAGHLSGAERTPQGWRIPRAALDDLAPPEPAPPTPDADTLTALRAELADWRRRAEVAEAVAAERAAALERSGRVNAERAADLAAALAALADSQRIAALAPYRTEAREITEHAEPATARRWLPRRWRNND